MPGGLSAQAGNGASAGEMNAIHHWAGLLEPVDVVKLVSGRDHQLAYLLRLLWSEIPKDAPVTDEMALAFLLGIERMLNPRNVPLEIREWYRSSRTRLLLLWSYNQSRAFTTSADLPLSSTLFAAGTVTLEDLGYRVADHIIWIDNLNGLISCMNDINKPGNVVAVDSEWVPVRISPEQVAAVLQLAPMDSNKIYLIDLVKLGASADQWIAAFFSGSAVKVGVYFKRMDLAGFKNRSKWYTTLESYFDLPVVIHSPYFDVLPDNLKWGIEPLQRKPNPGLSDVSQAILGKPLDKTVQVSNWEWRPLEKLQVLYAALDVATTASILREVRAYALKAGKKELFSSEHLEKVCGMEFSKVVQAAKRKAVTSGEASTDARANCFVLESAHSGATYIAQQRGYWAKFKAARKNQDWKFVVPQHLSKVAKQLRTIGVDAEIMPTSQFQPLIDYAMTTGAVILHYHSPAKRSDFGIAPIYWLTTNEATECFREILNVFELRFAKKDICSRCSKCNSNDWEMIPASEADVPYRIKERHEEFWKCRKCGWLFWEGGMFEKAREYYLRFSAPLHDNSWTTFRYMAFILFVVVVGSMLSSPELKNPT